MAVTRSHGAPRSARAGTVAGPIRPGRRTKLLVGHLVRGDIALIDHLDIDRVSAEELIAAGTVAVLNCRPSSGGSYPNLGPQLLVEAGILLVDLPDDSLFDVSPTVTPWLSGRSLRAPRWTTTASPAHRGPGPAQGQMLAQGEILDLGRVHADTEARRLEIDEALERFAQNTIEHMREERELLAGRIELPRFTTDFRDRSTLVVVRGVGHQRDLRALRPFIRDMRPVIVAVDGGADALLDAGLPPSMIVGDMDSAGEAALRCGAELVVHSYPDGEAPGRHRLEQLGLPFKLVPAPGTSQDVAMLIAAEKGARLIVSVGSQFNLVDFLDRNRKGMSSTFLTRLRIGEILVDAKGVSRLYRPRPGLDTAAARDRRRAARDGRGRLGDARAARRGRTAVAAVAAASRPRLTTGSRTPMFDYRYHALSLAAVLLALMIGVLLGVAIGDSNLVSSAKNGIVANLNSEVGQARSQASQLQDTARDTRKRSPTVSTRSPCMNCWSGARSGSCSSATPPTRWTGSCGRPSPRPAGTSRRSSPCRFRSTSTGIAHEAAGTHYASVGDIADARGTSWRPVGRQLVSGGPAVGRELDQPRARQPVQRLRRSARAPRRARRRAR